MAKLWFRLQLGCYQSIMLFVIPCLTLRILYLSRYQHAYRHGFLKRFWPQPTTTRPVIWLHTVSLGEYKTLRPLLARWIAEDNQHDFLVTYTTATACAQLQQETLPLHHQYLPFDHLLLMQQMIKRYRVTRLILMEREFWPALITCCADAGIKITVVNGLMSATSFKRYHKLRGFFRHLFQKLEVLSQDDTIDARFKALGCQNRQIIGSLKYAQTPLSEDMQQQVRDYKQRWAAKSPIMMAASTHPGEEAIILQAFRQLKLTFPDLKLILAPRHLERWPELLPTLSPQQYLSHSQGAAQQEDILCVDTFGELQWMYQLADIAFIGGSLFPDIGGHNLIEAAYADCAILIGPHQENFERISEQWLQQGAAQTVSNLDDIVTTVTQLITEPNRCQAMITQSQQCAQRYSHVVDDYLQVLTP